MRLCVKCGQVLQGDGWACAGCGHTPEIRDGIPCLAPHLMDSKIAFDVNSFDGLAEREEQSFWYQPRNRLISWAFRRYFPDARSFFELGCGTGIVLKQLAQDNPDIDIVGGDIFLEGLPFALERLAGRGEIMQLDGLNLLFDEQFDVVGAFDIVEHIENDMAALKELRRVLKPGGGVMITVPRHMFMWSRVDDLACHKRRYSGSELYRKIEDAGFRMTRQMTFGALTLPLQYVSRRWMKKKGETLDEVLELRLPKAADFLLEKMLNLDQIPIRAGVNYPFGATLLAIARKI